MLVAYLHTSTQRATSELRLCLLAECNSYLALHLLNALCAHQLVANFDEKYSWALKPN